MSKSEQVLIKDLTDTGNFQALRDWLSYLESIESPRHRLCERLEQAIETLARVREGQHA